MLIFRLFFKLRLFYFNWYQKKSTCLYRKKLKEISGEKSDLTVGYDVMLSGLNMLKVGKGVKVGSGCFFRCEGGVEIHDNVIISRNVTLYSCSHEYEGEKLPFDENYRKRSIIIEKNVWIGMNVNISPGTIIREGAIIGMGASVHGEIPRGAIVGAQCGTVVKFRNPEHYNRLSRNS